MRLLRASILPNFNGSASATYLLLLACLISTTSGEAIFQFTYQSQKNSLTEGISLLTLCLGPLIAHIIAGFPSPTYLSHRRPVWHNLLGHFNPTSILWRYYIITSRRILFKHWSSHDMAASCALFWTSDGWDRSQEMMIKSREFCTRVPTLRRISVVSVSAAKTLIATIQELQSIYAPVVGFSNGDYYFSVSFSSVFSGVAFLRLMRLPAALWLTDGYSYMNVERGEGEFVEMRRAAMSSGEGSVCAMSTMGLLCQDSGGLIPPEELFHPTNSWKGILIQFLFLLPIIGVVALILASIAYSQTDYGQVFTATYLALAAFYLTLIVGLVVIIFIYFGLETREVLFCRA